MTLGVERCYDIGFGRLNCMGTYAEWAKRKQIKLVKMFGPNFRRPGK